MMISWKAIMDTESSPIEKRMGLVGELDISRGILQPVPLKSSISAPEGNEANRHETPGGDFVAGLFH